MKYKNAQDILPDALLKELQSYVAGETLYVPQAREKYHWGEVSGARRYYQQRNEHIRSKFKLGKTLDEIALEYSLTVDTIRKIVYSSDVHRNK